MNPLKDVIAHVMGKLYQRAVRNADLQWNEMLCPKCLEVCEGEDLGDHPGYLSFSCECGHDFDQDRMAEFMSNEDERGKAYRKYGE